jgi:phage terminase small subunit
VLKFGLVVKAQSGFPVQSPYLSIANQQSDRMLRLLIEFGCTPSSRSRVTVTKPAAAAEFAKFVKPQ